MRRSLAFVAVFFGALLGIGSAMTGTPTAFAALFYIAGAVHAIVVLAILGEREAA